MADYKMPVRDEFAWQSPVLDKDLNAAPGTPSKADRYIVASTVASGDAWFGQEGNIAEWDGVSAWQFYTPAEGWFTWVKDENKLYKHDGTSWSEFTPGGSRESTEKSINQSSHGFVVGDVLKHNSTIYAKARADSAANAEVVGIVSAVADVDNFTLTFGGYISSLSSLTAGTVYFLDPATAGAYTSTEPSTEGQISKPLFVAVSATECIILNMRGAEITGNSYSYLTSFTSADLVSGILTVTHNLGEDWVVFQVWDDSRNSVIAPGESVDSNTLKIDLSSVTVSGTWYVRVIT